MGLLILTAKKPVKITFITIINKKVIKSLRLFIKSINGGIYRLLDSIKDYKFNKYILNIVILNYYHIKFNIYFIKPDNLFNSSESSLKQKAQSLQKSFLI